MDKNKIIQIDLIQRIKKGENSAFELLFKLYYSPLLHFARVYVKQTDAAEEIVQETFIKVWETRASLDENQSIKAYLYRCIHNNSINYIKKLQLTRKLAEEYINELIYRLRLIEQETPQNYFDILAQEELEKRITMSIDSLPPQCREIFILCRLDGLSYQQIADKLNISINTVKTQLSRALQKIRTDLKISE